MLSGCVYNASLKALYLYAPSLGHNTEISFKGLLYPYRRGLRSCSFRHDGLARASVREASNGQVHAFFLLCYTKLLFNI